MKLIIRALMFYLVVAGLVFSCVLFMGCAAPVYFEAAVGYRVDELSDWYLRSERGWQCSEPWIFDAEFGYEFDNNVRLGIYHESQLFCGMFNHKPELYSAKVRLSKKWGGK